jgi:hypothetical protein
VPTNVTATSGNNQVLPSWSGGRARRTTASSGRPTSAAPIPPRGMSRASATSTTASKTERRTITWSTPSTPADGAPTRPASPRRPCRLRRLRPA